jgi:hypothetical protein
MLLPQPLQLRFLNQVLLNLCPKVSLYGEHILLWVLLCVKDFIGETIAARAV